LEAGVTQGQLADYLKEKGIKLWMDCTGAGPDASIVGNALERGFGHTPYADHFNSIGTMEVVMPDGSVLNTGFGHYANSKASNVFPNDWGRTEWHIYPVCNGIVIKMTVWLMPEPENFQAFFFSIKEFGEIASVVDILQPLRIRGVLPSAIHLANDLRVLSTSGKFSEKSILLQRNVTK